MKKKQGKKQGKNSIAVSSANKCNTNHWRLRKGLKFQDNAYGFVYRITNKSNGKWYIGQKKIDKRGLWKSYQSSSNKLKEEIARLGEENFTFEILEFVDCKWMLNYLELYYQIILEAMFDENSYNGIVNVRLKKFASMKERWKKVSPNEQNCGIISS